MVIPISQFFKVMCNVLCKAQYFTCQNNKDSTLCQNKFWFVLTYVNTFWPLYRIARNFCGMSDGLEWSQFSTENVLSSEFSHTKFHWWSIIRGNYIPRKFSAIRYNMYMTCMITQTAHTNWLHIRAKIVNLISRYPDADTCANITIQCILRIMHHCKNMAQNTYRDIRIPQDNVSLFHWKIKLLLNMQLISW